MSISPCLKHSLSESLLKQQSDGNHQSHKMTTDLMDGGTGVGWNQWEQGHVAGVRLATMAIDIKEENCSWAAETHLPWGAAGYRTAFSWQGVQFPAKNCNSLCGESGERTSSAPWPWGQQERDVVFPSCLFAASFQGP